MHVFIISMSGGALKYSDLSNSVVDNMVDRFKVHIQNRPADPADKKYSPVVNAFCGSVDDVTANGTPTLPLHVGLRIDK